MLNIDTGGRFTTYAIEAARGSRAIAVNGAAARLVQKGDKVIIVAYCHIRPRSAQLSPDRWLFSAKVMKSSAPPRRHASRRALWALLSMRPSP